MRIGSLFFFNAEIGNSFDAGFVAHFQLSLGKFAVKAEKSMGFFQRISLQRKQTLIIMLTSGAALLLACLTFAAYDVMTFRGNMVNNLSTLALIVGDNSIAALDFDDPKSAEETLQALRAEPSVNAGGIYKNNGQIFAAYFRTPDEKKSLPVSLGRDGEYFSGNTLHLFRQIHHNRELLGTVYVQSDLDALYPRLQRYGIIVLCVFAMSSLVALFLSGRLQKIVSGPILDLARTARAVTREKNFSVRADKRSEDELGTLVDSFNEMLSEIQLRDSELQKATDVLEQRVEERTHELANSLSLLGATLQSTADGILVRNGEGDITNFNEQFVQMWRIPRKVADTRDNQQIRDVIVKQINDPEKFLNKIQELKDRPEMESFDLVELKDGRVFERYSKPQQIGEKCVGRVWSFRDITGRKQAEAILQRTEELYRRAIGGAGAVPYSYDYKTRSYLFIGEGIKQLIGYAPNEMSPSRWNKIIQESVMIGDTAGLSKDEAAKRVVKGEIRNWRCDMRVRTRDGKFRWISDASVQTLDESGKPTGSMGILQDITERKEAEQALRERDEKFNQMAANITDVFWMRSPDLREVHYVSPAFERIWGLSAQSHYSNPEKWIDAVVPEDRERVQAEFSRLTKDAPTLDIEYRITRTDGEIRWIHVRGFQVRDAAGKLVRLTGIVTDITERKHAEISTLAFSKLGRNLSSASSPFEAAKIISEVSDELLGWDACSLQLYSEEDDTIHSIFEADASDGKRFQNPTLTQMRRATALHHRILNSGGELILRDESTEPLTGAVGFGNKARPSASIIYVPIRYRTRRVGILSVHSYTANSYDKQDLKTLQTLADHCGGTLERIRADEAFRKSESQFRLVWETSADGMRLVNREGIVLLANKSYCRMVGKTKAEVEGKPLSIVHCAENADYIQRKHREEMAGKSFKSHLETEVTLWNGKKIWFGLSNSLLELPEEPPLLLTIFHDITQRKQAEAELKAVHDQLLETSRQAGMAEVATSVLHNVGNVLNSVNVSSSLIREKVKKSRVANLNKVVGLLQEHGRDLPKFFASDARAGQLPGYLSQLTSHLAGERDEMLEEIASLVHNIEHIKEIVAMQQSYAKVSGISESLHVADLVEDALRMNAGAMERHGVQVIREYSDVPPVLVEKHKVLQILVNLMRNAKYALDESKAEVREMRLRIDAKDDEFVRISVIDNGIGIPKENLTRVFNHGFTTRKDGHGFGLHSGALAARELGGALIAYSDGIGKGAIFTLELPCQKNLSV